MKQTHCIDPLRCAVKSLFKVAATYLVLLGLSTFLVACNFSNAENRASAETLKIGVVTYRSDDTFINALTAKITASVRQQESTMQQKFVLNIISANGDQNQQNVAVERMLRQGYDVMCVNLVDRTTASVIIQKCKRESVPLIFFNREPVQEDMRLWNQIYYVGTPSEDPGSLQGEILLDLAKSDYSRIDQNGDGKIQYVMLEGESSHQDALLRTDSSVKVLTDEGFVMDKLASDTADWEFGKAYNIMSTWLNEYADEIEVVISNNDDMALGALRAAEVYGIDLLRSDAPIFLGFDGTPTGLTAIKNGVLFGSVINDYVEQASVISKLAINLALGKDITTIDFPTIEGNYCRVPHRMVTIANISSELNKAEEIR